MDNIVPISGIIAATIVALGIVLIARMIIDAVVRVKVARYTGVDPGPKPKASPDHGAG